MSTQAHQEPIFIGAEIFIEPGQTPQEIDHWFKTMSNNGMKITRIRMFETYMHFPGSEGEGVWDFSLFDQAFVAAEKYGVLIYANLFPSTEFSDVGGFKFPKSKENFEAIANYIRHVVGHFSQFSSLYGWVPINEPGAGELPIDSFTTEKFNEWQTSLLKPTYNSNGFITLEFAEQHFLLSHNTWFLQWLTQQIRIYDAKRPIHVNNHDIFRHVSEYDFPAWRKFLTSLGGSAHVSWHFNYFTRQQYAVAMSANAEILRSGAGPIPWFMTELQGGNNTYSGSAPMCPTKEEIVQWLWINIGAGSRGAIFWCLNPRRSGFEAGEWAMLNFQDEPSDRMLSAAAVAGTINSHHDLFDQAEVLDSGINVLYVRESMWVEKALQMSETELEGREPGGVMKSAVAYFEALSEMGINPGFKEIREYDFSAADFKGQVLILAHQVSIPSDYWLKLDDFVAKGGMLIADGLTGYYDENAHFVMGSNFPLRRVFGGLVKEFKTVDKLFDVELEDPALMLKAHLWCGSLLLDSAKPLACREGEVVAAEHHYGRGKVIWLPFLAGLGARIGGDYTPLIAFLQPQLETVLADLPVRLKNPLKGIVIKLLKSAQGLILIAVNKTEKAQEIEWIFKKAGEMQLLFKNASGTADMQGRLTIQPEETLVYCFAANAGLE